MSGYEAYERARGAVLAAREDLRGSIGDPGRESAAAEELREREADLRLAESDVRGVLDRAWQANLDAVQRAKEREREERIRVTEVRLWASDRARRRDRRYPVLTAEEQDAAAASAAQLAAARVALEEARRTFKAGVTAEQLAAAASPDSGEPVPPDPPEV